MFSTYRKMPVTFKQGKTPVSLELGKLPKHLIAADTEKRNWEKAVEITQLIVTWHFNNCSLTVAEFVFKTGKFAHFTVKLTQNWVLKIAIFCQCESQSDISGKEALKMDGQRFCATTPTVKTLWMFKNVTMITLKPYDDWQKSWKGNNDSQSSCWLSSFPTLSINAAVHRRHLTSLFSSLLYLLTEICGKTSRMFGFYDNVIITGLFIPA